MKGVFWCVMALLAVSTAQNPTQVAMSSGQKEVVTAMDPFEKAFVAVSSGQCSNVKKVLGMSYEEMKGKQEPDVNKLTVVYRTKSTTKVYNISNAAASLREEHVMDSREKVIVYVHGFTDNPKKESFMEISDCFLNSEEAERIILLALDCSALIQYLYLRCTTYVMFIGDKLAEMMFALIETGLKHSQIHFVGHSLGAHICGFAGRGVFVRTGAKVGRITGLDPAGPCFTNVDPTYRLNNTDAEYVDVIHTDAGVYGIRTPLGHADYFPNNGEKQPDCWFHTCSHGRPNSLFAESLLKNDAFPARRCTSWRAFTEGNCSDEISYMGYASQPGTRGLFYLQTAGSRPYGLGMNGTKYQNNVGVLMNFENNLWNLPGFNNLPIPN